VDDDEHGVARMILDGDAILDEPVVGAGQQRGAALPSAPLDDLAQGRLHHGR